MNHSIEMDGQEYLYIAPEYATAVFTELTMPGIYRVNEIKSNKPFCFDAKIGDRYCQQVKVDDPEEVYKVMSYFKESK